MDSLPLFIDLLRLTTMTTKKNLLAYLFAGLFITFITGACNKNDAPVIEEKEEFTIINAYTKQDTNGVVYVTDYPLDPAQISDDLFAYDAYTYFDFNTHAFVSVDKVQSPTAWDIAFVGKDGDQLFTNGFQFNVRFEDPLEGDNRTSYLKSDFDSFNAVPAESEFTNRWSLRPGALSTIESSSIPNQYWATIDLSEEVGTLNVTPIADHLVVYKLTDGRYVKFKMISIYKGALTSPTQDDYKTKRGYISFKYYITEEGSTDLTTKK